MNIGYGQITKRSFSIAKKAKWLWIYGILLASGSGFNFSRSLSSQDIQNVSSSMPDMFSGLENVFATWTSQLSPVQISTFFGSVAVFTLFTVIIKLVLDSWAEASIVYGAEEAVNEKPVILSNTSKVGLEFFKTNIALKFISVGMAMVLFLAVIIPAVILAVIGFALKASVVSIIVGVLALVAFIFVSICLSGASVYGVRLIVLKNYTAWNAWKDGFKLAKRYPFKLVLTGLISGFISGVVTFLGLLVSLFILGLPVYFLISPLFVENAAFSLAPIIPTVIIFFVFIWFNTALTGAVMTFKTAFWNQFFNKLWIEK